jgi:hypothetical protein
VRVTPIVIVGGTEKLVRCRDEGLSRSPQSFDPLIKACGPHPVRDPVLTVRKAEVFRGSHRSVAIAAAIVHSIMTVITQNDAVFFTLQPGLRGVRGLPGLVRYDMMGMLVEIVHALSAHRTEAKLAQPCLSLGFLVEIE